MAEGRSKADWATASSLMAMTANVNRDPKRRAQPFGPEDFNPWTETRQAKRSGVTWVSAKDMKTALRRTGVVKDAEGESAAVPAGREG